MLRILLVEDNPADAQMFETALRKTGVALQITVIGDGQKAIDYLATDGEAGTTRNCDIVLLDLNLPRLSGFEVLEHIRRCANLQRVPVIVMSGSTNIEEIDRCYQGGANSYICKPIHLMDILATASRLVEYWANCVQLPSKRTNTASTLSPRLVSQSK